jgi:phosphate transport system substrate-binding protein
LSRKKHKQALVLLLMAWVVPSTALAGSITVAGHGPELPVIERLARTFEKANLGSYVDVQWDPNSQPVELVKTGAAQVAVTAHEHPGLMALPLAWDAIALVVDATNPVKQLTTAQAAGIFGGTVKRWSELGGADTTIQVIDRPPHQHIRQGLEEALGIAGHRRPVTKVINSDQRAISTVAGNLAAITYASLGVAQEAVQYGVSVTLLMIDGAEAAEDTVKDGGYKLRRQVLLLTKPEPAPLVEAFVKFARSPEGQAIVDELFIPYAALRK